VAAADAPPADDLRRTLARQLPDYMLPSAFVVLDALPLTPNRKVDRKALPAPDAGRPDGAREYAPPTTPTEQAIAAIWQDLLRVEGVGLDDNFFDLGGHSLLAVECVARVESELGLRVAPREMVYQTLRQVAANCEVAPPPGQGRGIVRRLAGLRATRSGRRNG
jgi:acyl carrier protein